MVRKYFSLILLLCLNLTIWAQNFNRPVPPNYPHYEFRKNTETNDLTHYLVTPFKANGPANNRSGHLGLLNKDGYLNWFSNNSQLFYLNFQYHPQQRVFSYIQTSPGAINSKFMVLDTNFNKIDSIEPLNGARLDNHDFLILDNGNYVISALRDSLIDLSAYMFDTIQGNDSTIMVGFVIQEIDTNGNLVFEWNSNDYIHPTDFIDSYGYVSNNFDHAHGNAIEQDLDDNYLISLRHTDAIYKINKTTGNIMWILGGKANQFTFNNDGGFSGQHDIRRLANENITLYDNANNSIPFKISRGVEYSLDTNNMTCTKIWESIYDPSFFARATGSTRTTTNNEKIVGYGFTFRPNPSFVHFDDNDNIISEAFFIDSTITYRTLPAIIPFNLNQPVINCSNINGNIVLNAPSSFTQYEWSTGETSQSISVTDTGIYQVWVKQGIGMLGSLPIHITNLQTPCGNSVGIEDFLPSKKSMKIIELYDLTGRKITTPKATQLYLARYNNGTSKILLWKNSYSFNK